MLTSVLLFSVHDQAGHPGQREHCRRGVASPCVYTHSKEKEVPQCAIKDLKSSTKVVVNNCVLDS